MTGRTGPAPAPAPLRRELWDEPIEVTTSDDGTPTAFRWRDVDHRVSAHLKTFHHRHATLDTCLVHVSAVAAGRPPGRYDLLREQDAWSMAATWT